MPALLGVLGVVQADADELRRPRDRQGGSDAAEGMLGGRRCAAGGGADIRQCRRTGLDQGQHVLWEAWIHRGEVDDRLAVNEP